MGGTREVTPGGVLEAVPVGILEEINEQPPGRSLWKKDFLDESHKKNSWSASNSNSWRNHWRNLWTKQRIYS